MGENVVPSWSELVDGFDLFRDPILCGTLAGLVLGFLGVFIVLRRMVFVTATISQSAGLGVALALFAEIHMGMAIPPVVGATALAFVAALASSASPERLRLSRESVLGMIYIVAGAGAVIVGDRISQEAHDLAGILFGTAVLVRPIDLALVAGVGVGVTLVHILWHRGFVFASFDPEGARVHGIPVRLLDTVLWLMIALEVSVATRALGVLPVFAFAVLPAMSALLFSSRMSVALPFAGLIGGLSGGLGYLAAFFFSMPVGAAQSAVAALFLLVLLPIRMFLR